MGNRKHARKSDRKKALVPGSEDFLRKASEEMLRNVGHMRRHHNLPSTTEVTSEDQLADLSIMHDFIHEFYPDGQAVHNHGESL